LKEFWVLLSLKVVLTLSPCELFSFLFIYFFDFSIMPETLIEPHNVLSPLPKRLWPQKQKDVVEKNTKKSEPAVQKIKDNMKVFAKWVERTDIKFWPGIIKQEEAEQDDKNLIVFEDGYEKIVKKEDIIRADALVPGMHAPDSKEPTNIGHILKNASSSKIRSLQGRVDNDQ
jgi:hypothetical protein